MYAAFIRRAVAFLTVVSLLLPSLSFAANPTSTINPSLNVQDPGALTAPQQTALGVSACGPTDANCYVDISSLSTISVSGNATLGSSAGTTNTFGTGAGSTNTFGNATGTNTVNGTTTFTGDTTLGDGATDTTTIVGYLNLLAAKLTGALALVFEGATQDNVTTTIAVTDPTANRTITLPDASGTVLLSGQASSVSSQTNTGTLDQQGTISNSTGNVSVGDSLVVTGTTDQQGALSNSTGNVSVNDNLDVAGNLTTTGTTTSTGQINANGGLAVSGGNLTVAANNNFTQTGTGTFSTGTGAVSLNGATTAGSTFASTGATSLATGGGATTVGGTLSVAGNQTNTGDLSVQGNTTLGNGATDTTTITGLLSLVNSVIQGALALVFEGATVDSNQTTFAITDPTADQTITFPDASGTVLLSGQSSSVSALINTGTSDLQGAISNSAGTLSLNDNTDVTGNLTVSGTTTSTGLVTGTAGFTTPANVTTTGTGDLVSGDDLTVADDATIGDQLTVTGALAANGGTTTTTLGSTGATTLASGAGSAATVGNTTGTTTILGSTTNLGTTNGATNSIGTGTAATNTIGNATGTNTINGTTTLSGATTVNNNLTVTGTTSTTGATSLATGGGTTTTGGDLTTAGDVTVTGNDLTFGNGEGFSNQTNGILATIFGAATDLFNILTGNLKVGDATPDVALNGEDAFVEGTFEVDGATRLDGTLAANAGITTTTLTTSGNTSVGGTLAVTGNQTNTGDLAVAGTTTSTGLVTGTAGFTTPANVTTTGTGDLVSGDDLTVADDATIGDQLTVTGNQTNTGTLSVTGALSIGTNASTTNNVGTGASAVNNFGTGANAMTALGTGAGSNVSIGSATGNTAITGPTTITGTLTSTSNTNLGTAAGSVNTLGTGAGSSVNIGDAAGTTTLNGTTTVNGNTTVSGTSTFTVGTGASTFGGSVTITPFSTVGVVHNDAAGLLTTSLIVNADVAAGAAIAYSKLNLASSILSSDITDGTIALADMGANAVNSATIVNNTVANVDLLDDTVDFDKIADNATLDATTTITNAGNNLNFTGAGTTNISDDAVAASTNIATGAAAKTLTLGSTNTTSSTTINAGTGGITLNGNTAVSGTNTFSTGTGAASFGGNVAVTGTTTLTGALTANAGLTLTGGDLTVGPNYNIIQTGTGGVSTGSGTISLNGNTEITGTKTLTVGTGQTTLGGALSVAGTTDLQGNVANSAGVLSLADDVSISGTTGLSFIGNGADITFTAGTNDITSAGLLRLGAFTLLGAITGNGQHITGIGDLSNLGNTTLGDAAADTLTVNATPTFNTDVSLNSHKITNLATPTAGSDAVTKSYVDSAFSASVLWASPVLSIAAAAPGAPATGDRYIVNNGATGFTGCADEDIAEWNGTSWTCTTPITGTTVYVDNGTDQPYTYNSTHDWVSMSGSINHNALVGLQGGQASEYYHLNAADYAALNISANSQIRNAGGTTALPGYSFSGDTDTGLSAPSANTLTLSTNGIARWTIDSSGNYVPNQNGSYDIGSTTNATKDMYMATGSALYLNNQKMAYGDTTNNNWFFGNSGNATMSGANNSAAGYQALLGNTTGSNNNAFGMQSLRTNSTGVQNTALGNQTLYSTTSGSGNSAVGHQALFSNTTGAANTVQGYRAGYYNTTGGDNVLIGYSAGLGQSGLSTFSNTTAVGYGALQNLTTGSANVALGYQTLTTNTTGGYNTAIGYRTLTANTIGGSNVALGYQALLSNTTGGGNIGIGSGSLAGNTTAGSNTAIGDSSLNANTTGSNNAVFGASAALSNITGSNNVALGANSLYNATTTSGQVAVGYQALQGAAGATGSGNSAVGYQALANYTTGDANNAFGWQALNNNTTGTGNNAVGQSALKGNTTGNYNAAFGQSTLFSNTTGSQNTGYGSYALNANTTGVANLALGYAALALNTTANNNVAVGHSALHDTVTGANNTAVGTSAFTAATSSSNSGLGYSAGTSTTTGSSNNAFGYTALYSNTTGDSNSVFGTSAGYSNITGSHNVAIGGQALYRATATSDQTAVGYQAMTGQTGASTGTGNSAFGYQALNLYTTGSNNTAEGYQALKNNSTGNRNNAHGYQALTGVTTGSDNVAIGDSSGLAITTGSSNTAIGSSTLKNSAITSGQTAVGYQAMQGQTGLSSGTGNSALGYQALAAYTTGSNNTATGYQALTANTTGALNSATGYSALASNSTGSNNTAAGYNSLYANTTGTGNTGNGVNSLASNTNGANNAGYGYQALYGNTTGQQNVAVGVNSLYYATTTSGQTAVGYQALQGAVGATGTGNSALGYQALTSYTTGSNNTANGSQALRANTSGQNNTSVGYSALLANTTASNNTATGYAALVSTTTGANNVANGSGSLFTNTTGANNSALGFQSGYYSTGSNNTLIGIYAGQGQSGLSTFSNTTGVGYQALQSVTTGTNNTALGASAGADITTGTGNLVLGRYTSGSGITTGSENILIGDDVHYGLTQTGSNQLNIGNLIFSDNVGTAATLATGNIGIGTSTVSNGRLNVSAGTSNALYLTRTASGQWFGMTDGTDAFGIYNRAGTPQGNIAADIGSLAVDTTNGALYIKTTDTVNTGWTQLSSGGTLVFSSLTAATTTNTIDNLLNAQTWNWSTATTQNALSLSANSLTSGSLLNLSSSSTALTGDLAKVEATGSNAAVTGSALKVGMTGAAATGTALNVTNAGTGLTARFNDDGSYSDTTPVVIDASGNVGVGTATPSNNAGYGTLTLDGTTSGALDLYSAGSLKARLLNGATTTRLGTTGATGLTLFTNNVDSVYLTNTGNLGVGTSTPNSTLDVAGTAQAFNMRIDDGASGGSLMFGSGSADKISANTATHYLTMSTNSTERVRIDASGSVGIGTTTPAYTLDVNGAIGFHNLSNNVLSNFYIDDNIGTGNPGINFDAGDYIDYDRTANLLTLTAGAGSGLIALKGNVGIGDTSPASALTVGSGDLFQVNSSGNIVKINNVTTSFPAAQGAASTVLTNDGAGNLSWAAAGGGVTTMAAVGAVPNANGASISGTTLTLQPADATNPGVITTAAQTIPGIKTFQDGLTFGGLTNLGSATTKSIPANGILDLSDNKTLYNVTSATVGAGSCFVGNGGGVNLGGSIAESATLQVSGGAEGRVVYVLNSTAKPIGFAGDNTSSTFNCGGTRNIGGKQSMIPAGSIGAAIYLSSYWHFFYIAPASESVSSGGSGGDSDLAEWRGAETDLLPGTIVMSGENDYATTVRIPNYDTGTPSGDSGDRYITRQKYMVPATTEGRGKIQGAIATAPSLVVGVHVKSDSSVQHPELVGLAGQIPVRVNLEGGDIAVGDAITTSSTPGVGMKATTSGMIVGYALEAFDATHTSDGDGMIEVSINTTTWVAPHSLTFLDTLVSELHEGTTAIQQLFSALKSQLIAWLASNDNGITDIHANGKLCLGTTCVTESQLNALLTGAAQSSSPASSDQSSADVTAPVLTLLGLPDQTISLNASWSDLGATAVDPASNGHADIPLDTVTASIDGSAAVPAGSITIDTAVPATHTIIYSATDTAGNTATITRTVTVLAASGSTPPAANDNPAPSPSGDTPAPVADNPPPPANDNTPAPDQTALGQ